MATLINSAKNYVTTSSVWTSVAKKIGSGDQSNGGIDVSKIFSEVVKDGAVFKPEVVAQEGILAKYDWHVKFLKEGYQINSKYNSFVNKCLLFIVELGYLEKGNPFLKKLDFSYSLSCGFFSVLYLNKLVDLINSGKATYLNYLELVVSVFYVISFFKTMKFLIPKLLFPIFKGCFFVIQKIAQPCIFITTIMYLLGSIMNVKKYRSFYSKKLPSLSASGNDLETSKKVIKFVKEKLFVSAKERKKMNKLIERKYKVLIDDPNVSDDVKAYLKEIIPKLKEASIKAIEDKKLKNFNKNCVGSGAGKIKALACKLKDKLPGDFSIENIDQETIDASLEILNEMKLESKKAMYLNILYAIASALGLVVAVFTIFVAATNPLLILATIIYALLAITIVLCNSRTFREGVGIMWHSICKRFCKNDDLQDKVVDIAKINGILPSEDEAHEACAS
jgi:hypothetical protein